MGYKEVTHINCPEEWKSENDWDSHRPFLWYMLNKLFDNSEGGNVTEMGCGYGSSLLLADLCNRRGRCFDFYETNINWYQEIINSLHDSGLWPDGFLCKNYLDIDMVEAFMFVDLAPGEIRKDVIKKFSDDCACIMAHDTEPGADYVYGMSEILSTFKYRLDYKPEGKPWTTAVSNVIDVSKWEILN